MRTTVTDGKELKLGNKFAEVKDKRINFFKVLTFSVSKPGKHGSSKKLVKSSNLMTGRSYECTFLGNTNVYLIDDFEYKLYPVQMVDQGFKQFWYDLEEELSLSANEFDSQSSGMLTQFRMKEFGKSADDLLVNENGERLCLLVNEVSLEGITAKFLWDILYVDESNLDKKFTPGANYDEFIKGSGPAAGG
ncbi:hypothetical protein ECANGB1_1623 [Enterospora canceri]|uniref:Uncharacterized protein n=1 Tax=Enterospora canceri TaxID=1081671 RepID=A0A1Y1S5M3_9MICR|nr:hypothetical protein ECANGB1_1623 [Enterospora canceri]